MTTPLPDDTADGPEEEASPWEEHERERDLERAPTINVNISEETVRDVVRLVLETSLPHIMERIRGTITPFVVNSLVKLETRIVAMEKLLEVVSSQQEGILRLLEEINQDLLALSQRVAALEQASGQR